MRLTRIPFSPLLISSAVFLSCLLPASAQKAPSAGSAGSGAGASVGSTGRGTIGTGSMSGNNGSFGDINGGRTIFLSGRVVLDDGAPPSSNIRIERVCSGNAHLETHTDSKGRFSLQLGQNLTVDTDAADANGGVRPNGSYGGSGFGNSSRGAGSYWNCEIRAAYPGYRSDVVELANRRSLDDPDVGSIILHRLANVQGSTISVTTALAPPKAQKAYEKGVQLAQKGEFEKALQRLTDATDLYPKYAIAWFALGRVDEQMKQPADARKAYLAAIEADAKYVSPRDSLAALSLRESKWTEAADYSKEAVSLNPVEFPSSFWYNAIANYQLKNTDAAEKSVRELLKLDTAHHYPMAENLFAHLLAAKGNYTEAAAHMRAYLALAPNAPDAAAVRQDLEKVQRASAEPHQGAPHN